jgi:IPT/TIG domain
MMRNNKLAEAESPASPYEPEPFGSGAVEPKRTQARTASRLGVSILAAVAGTILTSVVNGSPHLKLAAALAGAALPAFVTEPGRYQRQRAVAAGLLAVVALILTYGGATVFSYAAHHTPIYPGQPAPTHAPPPSHPSPTAPSSPGSGGGTGAPGGHAGTGDITGVSPGSGSTAGGDTVTITGSGFTNATSVGFGRTSAQSFTVDSGTQITAISPPGSGTVDITVVTPDGTTPTGPADQFTYAMMTPGVSPGSGSTPATPSPSQGLDSPTPSPSTSAAPPTAPTP